MPKGIPKAGKRRSGGKRGPKKKFAQSVKKSGARRGRPPGTGKKTAHRVSAKNIVLTKFEELQELIRNVADRNERSFMTVQRAALFDKVQTFVRKNNGSLDEFCNENSRTLFVMKLTKDDLEKMLSSELPYVEPIFEPGDKTPTEPVDFVSEESEDSASGKVEDDMTVDFEASEPEPESSENVNTVEDATKVADFREGARDRYKSQYSLSPTGSYPKTY